MKNDTYLYTHGLDTARREGDIALWRASHQANIACKKAIEDRSGMALTECISKRTAPKKWWRSSALSG